MTDRPASRQPILQPGATECSKFLTQNWTFREEVLTPSPNCNMLTLCLCWQQEKSSINKRFFIKIVDLNLFCENTDNTVLDFWWCLLCVLNPGVFLLCMLHCLLAMDSSDSASACGTWKSLGGRPGSQTFYPFTFSSSGGVYANSMWLIIVHRLLGLVTWKKFRIDFLSLSFDLKGLSCSSVQKISIWYSKITKMKKQNTSNIPYIKHKWRQVVFLYSAFIIYLQTWVRQIREASNCEWSDFSLTLQDYYTAVLNIKAARR